jgi:NADPH:quinone reductase-like Zn-dependent oxidoreductase
MQAVVLKRFGSPDDLDVRDLPRPEPAAGEILVRVRASSINSWDWGLLTGKPFLARMSGGSVRKPKIKILGCDIAGEVAAVGAGASRFKPGDAVFGDIPGSGWGGFAEYVCVREDALMAKPANLAFDAAAAVPQAAVLALLGSRIHGGVQAGQRVLINGAGGGAGTFAIQMAKAAGAHVTGVDNANKLEGMRAVGADEVLDYTRDDFTKSADRYDRILDMEAHHSIFTSRRSLNPGGSYAMVGGGSPEIIQVMLLAPLLSLLGNTNVRGVWHKPNKGLDEVVGLLEAGTVAPIIDSRFALADVADAFRHYAEGHFVGKIVVTV